MTSFADLTSKNFRFLEPLLVAAVLAVTAIMWSYSIESTVLLHLYYVPVVLTGFALGRGRGRLMALPAQCAAAWHASKAVKLPRAWPKFERVLVGGMGGSAIAGDLVAGLAKEAGGAPVSVVRDFQLPGPARMETLHVLCSFSGATEETLSLYSNLRETGAPLAVVTGGGSLEAQAESAGLPVFKVDAPGEPRSAVGYNLMLLLGLLDRARVLPVTDTAVADAVEAAELQVESVAPEVPASANPAKSLAQALQGRLAVIYGGGLFAAVALRWKSQLNENAKAWAFSETIPEVLHNSVESYGPDSGIKENVAALLLEPAGIRDELARRYAVLAKMLERAGISVHSVKAADAPPLTQLLSMLVLGDFVSYYLALLRGVEPSGTPTINWAKDWVSNLHLSDSNDANGR